MTNPRNLVSVRSWALLAATVTALLTLALSLGAREAFAAPAFCRPPCDASCGTGPNKDPYVTEVSPQDGATDVPRNAKVKVIFSEEMDPNTVNANTFQLHTFDSLFLGGGIYATVSPDPTDAIGRTWVLDPYGATTSTTLLSVNRKYRVTVTTGVRDLEDGFLPPSNKVWYFTTGSS
jgi:Bacterial Ig-like domain